MLCENPLKGWRSAINNAFTLNQAEGLMDAPLEIACKTCINCRVNRAREWVTRFYHESQGRPAGEQWFITLTYAPEHLPDGADLHYDDVQKFLKRLRRQLNLTSPHFKYYCACEYGEAPEEEEAQVLNLHTGKPQLGRPHYHIAVWGLPLDDYEESSWNGKGTSELLSERWGLGQVTVDPSSEETYEYVAGYVTKKIYGKYAEKHYIKRNPETGEEWTVSPEIAKMSVKPAIGGDFIKRDWKEGDIDFENDLRKGYVHDHNGKPMKVPSYYKELLKRTHRQDIVEEITANQLKSAEAIEELLSKVPEKVRKHREWTHQENRHQDYLVKQKQRIHKVT